MYRDAYEILDGALLISDAHYSPSRRPELLALFKAVESGALQTPQLILLGDIFDLLFGEISVTHAINADAVAHLQRISTSVPVLYFEGNHDYNLKTLFPDATVVPLGKQPFACRWGEKRLLLAHGDFHQPLKYRLYTALIRNPFVLRILAGVNRFKGNGIIEALEAYLGRKNDCHVIEGYRDFVQRHLVRLRLDEVDMFIEGHYHQGVQFDIGKTRYVNPDAFACNRKYGCFSATEQQVVMQEWV